MRTLATYKPWYESRTLLFMLGNETQVTQGMPKKRGNALPNLALLNKSRKNDQVKKCVIQQVVSLMFLHS